MADMLVLDAIKKTYNPGSVHEKAMFQGFNLAVPQGQFVSIVGSNGSGKTTMLNLISGTLPVDGGRIRVAGQDMTHMSPHRRARRIGRVFQDPAKGTCESLTILENMALADHKGRHYGLGPGVNRRREDAYREMLAPLGLGLQSAVHQRVGSLSGGQRQALALLIATMTPVDLLILDEHTAALDPRSSETVMRLTEQIVREKQLTTLMVTHNLKHAVQYGDRILMMHQGNIVLDKAGRDKQDCDVNELLKLFTEISVELGN